MSRSRQTDDLSSGNRFDAYKETGSNGVVFSPDGNSLYALAGRGTVNRHDAPSFQQVSTFANVDGDILSLSVSADGRSAVGHLLGGGLCFWETSTGRLVNQFPSGPNLHGHRVSFMPNGRQVLASGSDEFGVQLINVDTGEVAHLYRFNEKPMPNRTTSLAVSTDGRLFLAAPDWMRQVAVVDVKSGRFVTDVKLDNARIAGLAFLPDGKHVLTGVGHSLVIWNPTTRREIHRFEMPSRETPISCVAVSPDGRFAISAAAAHLKPDLSANYDDIHVWRLPEEVWPKQNPQIEPSAETVPVTATAPYQRPGLPTISQKPLCIMTHGLPIPSVLTAEEFPGEWREAGVFARIQGVGSMRFPKLNIKSFAAELDVLMDSAEHLGGAHFIFQGSKTQGSPYFFVRVIGKDDPNHVFGNLGMLEEFRPRVAVPGFEVAFGESVKLTLLVREDHQLLCSEGGTLKHFQICPLNEDLEIRLATSQKAVDMTIQRFLLRALTDEEKSLLDQSKR